jgi:uncharacterized FAD-dependent dehydrogenase
MNIFCFHFLLLSFCCAYLTPYSTRISDDILRKGNVLWTKTLIKARDGKESFSKEKRPRRTLQPNRQKQTWRVFGVEVHPDRRVKDLHEKSKSALNERRNEYLPSAVLDALYGRLKSSKIREVRLVRRSIDARPHKKRSDGGYGPRFVYVLDVEVNSNASTSWKQQPGRLELLHDDFPNKQNTANFKNSTVSDGPKPRVIIVGAGPAGLFCALELARTGAVTPIVLERGQPVESRGRDIGALMHRRSLDTESNFCFGEGGAGTWSDGKLTTRIGRNSEPVRHVLETFVEYGAPSKILVEGAPHLGTDNLVRLLQNMRTDLRRLGGEVRFGTKVTDFIFESGVAKGVEYSSKPAFERNYNQSEGMKEKKGVIFGEAIVLATGHSARDVYEQLHDHVQLESKGFAVGFRVEHSQKLINKIQYGLEWAPSVVTGKKTTDTANEEFLSSFGRPATIHEGNLPVPSYRLATAEAFDGQHNRSVYSFCMCPGGCIVLSSTEPDEICVNGMSFSKRDSRWANSALVVSISPGDDVLKPYFEKHGVLAGVAFQREMERRAATMGGGNLTVPVQRLTDFVAGRTSTSAPPSSYRLGVKPSACHEIYPTPIVQALRCALVEHFDKQMPGFLCEDGLLHAVETRTSSPVRVCRDQTTMQAIGATGLFPAGEGAGYAGGIVSAAVDGHMVAQAVLNKILGRIGSHNRPYFSKAAVDSFY